MKCQNMIVYLRKLVSPSTHWCKLFPQHCHWHSLYSILTCSWLMKCCHTHGAPLGPFTHLALSTPQLYASSSMLSSSFSGDWRPFWFFLFLYSCLISSVQSEAELQSSSAGGDQHRLVSQLLARLLQLGCERRLFHLGSNYLFSIFFIESQSKHFNELYIFIILT